MSLPESALSARGVEVSVHTSPHQDCPHGSLQAEVRYGRGGGKRSAWFPYVERCWDAIEHTRCLFLEDRDSIGRERMERPELKKAAKEEL